MSDQTKPWQHGYALDELQRIEDQFSEHNAWSVSPFSEMNKPKIAEALHTQALRQYEWGIVDVSHPKREIPIKAYLDVVMAYKRPGDQMIDAFCYSDRQKLIEYLRGSIAPRYLWIWQESDDQVDIAKKSGFVFIGSKITSFAEIRGLWFKDGATFPDGFDLFGQEMPRVHPQLDEAEFFGLKQADVFVPSGLLYDAINEVKSIRPDYFTDHYSNYNRKHSWSALSLRGYTADPTFITKPAEMNKKWKAEHADETFELQDTPLRQMLPNVDRLASRLVSRTKRVHRIRLMKLAPGGGELRRHTDLVDKDTGIADGHLARFHIPIITNDKVVFGSWNMHGHKTEVNMRVGECWYLDTRKPHTAVNGGVAERIHLVIDVESNEAVRGLLRCD